MYLKVADDQELPLDVREERTHQSAHTGRTLRLLEVTAGGRVFEDTHGKIVAVLGSDTVETLDEDGTVTGTWTPQLHSHSRSGDTRTYAFSLAEAEDLHASRVSIDGIDLEPYKYEERADEPGITITFRARTSPEVSEELTALVIDPDQKWFPVVREGIAEEPLTMRFGRTEWSKHEDHHKHELVLVEQPPEDYKERRPLDFADHTCRAHTAYSRALHQALTDVLVEKGVLSDEEASGIEEVAQSNYRRQLRNMDLVEDVDRWDDL